MIARLTDVRAAAEKLSKDAKIFALADCKLLSPVANPGKIVAAPVNYKKHLEEAQADPELHHQNKIAEIQRVGLFLKATSSLAGAGEGIEVRHADRRTDHEIELVAVIGSQCNKVKREDAMKHIAGYCIGLDITVRGPEERSLRKSIDSYSVMGPYMVTADSVRDPSNLDFELTLNGETRQKANTRDLIIGIADLTVFASAYYTLMPGDLLMTGTPDGVGPITPGDVIDARIDQLGSMQVKVR
ncbi:MAG TPA: fumarylacetoacetate hydrolase family protein [Pseudolabrys sp.]|nr:fumarylacetoacetate hydrolase family protein [Pseudolabrys sp.]